VTGIVNTAVANVASRLEVTAGPEKNKTPALQNKEPSKNKERS